MDLVRGIASVLTMWIVYHAAIAQEKGTETDQKPQVQIKMKVGKSKPTLKNILNLNYHLQSDHNKGISSKEKTASPEFLDDQAVSSVIFNEIQSLVLTKSSFKIISYIDFAPHLATLVHIDSLLQDTLEKANSFLQHNKFPPYHYKLTGVAEPIQNIKDESIKIQLTDLTYEIAFVTRNFNLIHDRFYQITGQFSMATPGEGSSNSYTDSKPPKGSSRSTRSVASSIFKFLFGGDDNSESIDILKQNVATLMENDELQESRLEDILKSQQLNSGEIRINRDLLRQMTKELAQLNHTLTQITFETEILFTLANFQTSISQLRHRVNIIRDALFGLQTNLEILYHHFSVMVNSKLTPEMISPTQLSDILQEVQEEIRDHPCLSLPKDLMGTSIYRYYKLIKFQITMEQAMMLGILQVPLIEASKEFTFYKIYNVPLPLPDAQLQIQYDLSFQYIAITKGDQYVAFPMEQEVMGCQLTAGAFCELNTAMFPTLDLTSCEFSLYKRAHEQVIKSCRVKTCPLLGDNALSLEPNYWVVITQSPIVLQINCLLTTTYLKVKYPIDIVHLKDGCEAASATLVLPGHSRLIKEDNFLMESHSVKFTLRYMEMQDFTLVRQIIPTQLSPEQLKAIGNSIPEPQVSSIAKLQGQLKQINTNYPYIMPFYLKIIITCISTILLVVSLLYGYRLYKRGCSLNTLVPSSCTKHTRTLRLNKTQDISEYITERYPPSWRQVQRPHSSVVIQEMEMHPMMEQGMSSTTLASPPAIEAGDAPTHIIDLLHPPKSIPATPE